MNKQTNKNPMIIIYYPGFNEHSLMESFKTTHPDTKILFSAPDEKITYHGYVVDNHNKVDNPSVEKLVDFDAVIKSRILNDTFDYVKVNCVTMINPTEFCADYIILPITALSDLSNDIPLYLVYPTKESYSYCCQNLLGYLTLKQYRNYTDNFYSDIELIDCNKRPNTISWPVNSSSGSLFNIIMTIVDYNSQLTDIEKIKPLFPFNIETGKFENDSDSVKHQSEVIPQLTYNYTYTIVYNGKSKYSIVRYDENLMVSKTLIRYITKEKAEMYLENKELLIEKFYKRQRTKFILLLLFVSFIFQLLYHNWLVNLIG